MVGFRNMGRMGNFLFEAATALAYSLKHGLDFTVPEKTNDPYWNPLYFSHLVNPNYNPNLAQIVLREKGHQYNEIPFAESWRNKNIILEGYFQSELYFKDYRPEILKAFDLPWHPHNDISIHVRRGDYLKYPHKHPVVPREYYVEALKIFWLLGYKEAYVFSDDIKWCKEFFPALKIGFVFHYSEGKTEMEDLIGISNCAGGHINSSSTFSWWSSWLDQNPKKVIVTPELWFVRGHGGLDVSTIIPESWIKI